MTSIFPDADAGGVVTRNNSGVATNPPNVENNYVPPAAFTMSCSPRALPSDCFSKIEPSQINAIVSELLCFAQVMNPDGNWDCTSLCNLGNAFTAWVSEYSSSATGELLCASPISDGTEEDAALLYCDDTGDIKKIAIDGEDSITELILGRLCASATGTANTQGDSLIYCAADGSLARVGVFEYQLFRGTYAQARSYNVNQMVRKGNLLYSPNANIPAGTPFAVGTTGATWYEVSPTVFPPYDETAGYSVDTVITLNGKFYAANDDIPPDTPFVIGTTGATWREVDFSQAFILPHNSTKVYQKNAVVTFDAILWRATETTGPGAFSPAGPWIKIGGDRNVFWGTWDQAHNSTEHRTDTQYQYLQGEVVVRNGLIYQANGNIPLNTAFAAGTGSTQWTEISASFAPPYEEDVAYSQDAVIYKDGQYYAANADIPAGTPFVIGTTGETWRLVTAGSVEFLLKDYDATKVYQPRSLIYRDQAIWMRTAAASAGPWNQAQWQLVGERSRYRGVFSTGSTYLTNDVVSLDAGSASIMQMPTGTLARATTNIAAGAFTAANWAVINRSSPVRGEYDQADGYSGGDIVFTNFGMYRANGTIAGGTPFAVGVSGATWETGNAVRVPGVITATTVTAVNNFADTLLRFTAAGTKTFTIPATSGSFQLPVGTTISGFSTGGQLTIAAGAGVTIRTRGGLVLDAVDYASFTLTKIDTNEWFLVGDFA